MLAQRTTCFSDGGVRYVSNQNWHLLSRVLLSEVMENINYVSNSPTVFFNLGCHKHTSHGQRLRGRIKEGGGREEEGEEWKRDNHRNKGRLDKSRFWRDASLPCCDATDLKTVLHE